MPPIVRNSILLSVLLHFVNCIVQWAGFDIQAGFTLDTNLAFQEMQVPSTCECRHVCLTNDQCFAYATKPLSAGWLCHLYEESPKIWNNTLIPNALGEIGSYIVPGWMKSDDGLYYQMLPNFFPTLNDSREACLIKPNGRLVVIKTLATFNTVFDYVHKALIDYVAVDMFLDSGILMLGDGSKFMESALWKNNKEKFNGVYQKNCNVITIYASQISCIYIGRVQLIPVCQANFLGLIY